MCTVSWLTSERGYDLLFNRDELNGRAPEQAPRVRHVGGVAFIAPRDGDRGGTWLLVNEFGVSVCLLNDYQNPWRPAVSALELLSRGDVVLSTAAARVTSQLATIIAALPLERVMPFRLLAVSPGADPILLEWDGTRLEQRSGAELVAPLASSSFRSAEVISARLGRFPNPAGAPGIAELQAYHRQHDREAGAYSVLMQRTDAATRSMIHVNVTESIVALEYRPVTRGAAGPSVGEPLLLRIKRRRQSAE